MGKHREILHQALSDICADFEDMPPGGLEEGDWFFVGDAAQSEYWTCCGLRLVADLVQSYRNF
jgi:hypothetical protein